MFPTQERYDVGEEMQLSDDEDHDEREERGRSSRSRKAPAQHILRRDRRDRREQEGNGEDEDREQQEEIQRRYKGKEESRDNIQVIILRPFLDDSLDYFIGSQFCIANLKS